jgi:hypothetical protein
MANQENRSIVANYFLAWFRPDEWREVKLICPDLHDTYEEWHANAEAGVSAFEAQGDHIEKVILTADELGRRERAIGRKIDQSERMSMAAEIGSKRNSTSH